MNSFNTPALIDLQTFQDSRGTVRHYGETTLDSIKRVYFITPRLQAGFRGWHGQRYESKIFRCLAGSVRVSSVEILDWDEPIGGDVFHFELNSSDGQLLIVPAGFANGVLPREEGSQLMVMSNKTLAESLGDDIRFDPEKFA
jgi:dTDP-4-dehydrorhamnose 3,5-epimerase